MGAKKSFNRTDIPREYWDRSNWPDVLTDGWSDEDKTVFAKRKQAVDMYFSDFHSLLEIETVTGIARTQLYRMLERCIQTDEDGVVMGYRALIRYRHLQPYTRRKSTDGLGVKLTGALEVLFSCYPELRDSVEKSFIGKSDLPGDHVKSPTHIWLDFLRRCGKLGIKPPQYPFNTADRGRKAIERYLQKTKDKYFVGSAKRHGKDAGYKASRRSGDGESQKVIRPYQTVQFDGHRIDAQVTVCMESPEGDTIYKVINRLWFLCLIDEATRAILGFHIGINKEYTAVDVLTCVRKSLVPWSEHPFIVPGFEFEDGWGFPSGVVEECKWGVWDELRFDNGKANLAQVVITHLQEKVGCAVNPGPVRSPEFRNIIERVFETLEGVGPHRLPSTTGSHPGDPKRQNAERNAEKHRITVTEIEELLGLLVAKYNATPHASLNHMSPLETIRHRIHDRGYTVRQLPEEIRKEVQVVTIRESRVVRGDVKSGRRPYVTYEKVAYTSDLLQRSTARIGQELTLVVDVEDLRIVHAYLADGSEFGPLRAQGRWSMSRHSLQTRKEINRLAEQRILFLEKTSDPMEIYLNHLRLRLKEDKSARNKAERVRREISRDTSIEIEEEQTENTLPDITGEEDYQQPTDNTSSKQPKSHKLKYNETLIL